MGRPDPPADGPADAPDDAPLDPLWARDEASRALGMQLVAVGPGRAVVRMPVTAAMANGHGTCHGGLIFALADSAFALACNAGRPPTVAAGADIAFLAPVTPGDLLEATAVERSAAGRSGITDVTVRRLPVARPDAGPSAGGAVVAEFRGRSRTLAAPVGPPGA